MIKCVKKDKIIENYCACCAMLIFQWLLHIINAFLCLEKIKYKMKVFHILSKLSMVNYIFEREEERLRHMHVKLWRTWKTMRKSGFCNMV